MLKAQPCVFSPCQRYRYTLWRTWPIERDMLCEDNPNAGRYLMIIGLNPSTANDEENDPTITREIGFAKTWGFGGLCKCNAFAWRDTHPENMKKVTDPVGPDNLSHIQWCATEAGMVLAAWGTHGRHRGQDKVIAKALAELGVPLFCLGKNADGTPVHPLYQKADTRPRPYQT